VSPSKYEGNILLENGTLYLVESFANFSNFAETSDFEVKITIQVLFFVGFICRLVAGIVFWGQNTVSF
jgi:thiamine transporter ThiT